MTTTVPPPVGPWRQVPNALSVARIFAAPVLVLLVIGGHERAYAWLLVVALFTDAVDGWMARGLHLESRVGARLDSIGDSAIWYAALAGIVGFHGGMLAAHRFFVGAIVAMWVLESALALWRYRRLSSFHTYASKVAGVLLSIYVGVLFVFGHQPWLLYLAGASSIVANAEEILLLRMLPQWRVDVRGAWWVWRERRRTRVAVEA
ncbi:MAG TPA: CDP-alcohol phosphatidyltransferase family protein [Steroidobacteraceae bacterium]|nr:CDP-alcohol phosphatidyltransferase family protein [Steroidobacteraceae bacterium]